MRTAILTMLALVGLLSIVSTECSYVRKKNTPADTMMVTSSIDILKIDKLNVDNTDIENLVVID